MADGLLNESADQALRVMERDTAFHDLKCQRILKQQEAYEGILKREQPAAEWESQLHAPLINHSIETAMTMLLDSDMRFQITPMPQEYQGSAWADAMRGAEAHETLFRRQMGTTGDRFDEFMRPYVLQAAISRVSIAKTHWRNETEKVKYLQTKQVFPFLGLFGPVKMKEAEKVATLFDGPVTEVVDLRDFYWPESAVSLDRASYTAHAVWMTKGELERLAQNGVYDKTAVDMLVGEGEGNKNGVPDGNEIELERERRGRKNDRYEVLEIWDRDTRTLHVIGGRRTLLLQQDWPFWHMQFPFVAMSLAPFPFSIQGLSLVEKLAPLQEAIWDLTNQTIDNNKLINNAIIVMAADFDDPDSWEWAPGAVNTVDNPQQVQMFKPEHQIAQAAGGMIDSLKSDLQNLAMGQPLSIPMSGRVTATEIATLSQIAQNAAQKMKDQIIYSLERIGYQRMRLNGQFIRETQHFIKRGPDGQPTPYSIPPHLFVGDYDYELTPSPDSAIRAERRAEAQSLMTLAVQASAPMAMMGAPLNGRAFMDKVLDSFDIEDKDEFYSQKPQTAGQLPGVPPAGASDAQGAGPRGEPVGVTGANSINPAVSPSSQLSLSPGTALARALASQGGLKGSQLTGAQ